MYKYYQTELPVHTWVITGIWIMHFKTYTHSSTLLNNWITLLNSHWGPLRAWSFLWLCDQDPQSCSRAGTCTIKGYLQMWLYCPGPTEGNSQIKCLTTCSHWPQSSFPVRNLANLLGLIRIKSDLTAWFGFPAFHIPAFHILASHIWPVPTTPSLIPPWHRWWKLLCPEWQANININYPTK